MRDQINAKHGSTWKAISNHDETEKKKNHGTQKTEWKLEKEREKSTRLSSYLYKLGISFLKTLLQDNTLDCLIPNQIPYILSLSHSTRLLSRRITFRYSVQPLTSPLFSCSIALKEREKNSRMLSSRLLATVSLQNSNSNILWYHWVHLDQLIKQFTVIIYFLWSFERFSGKKNTQRQAIEVSFVKNLRCLELFEFVNDANNGFDARKKTEFTSIHQWKIVHLSIKSRNWWKMSANT